MREIAWIEREGGGPVRVRVRDRVRIDNTIIEPGGWTSSSSSSSSDRLHNYIEPGGGGPVRVRDRVRIDNTIIEPGGVDQFEFEFGSTTQLSSRGGWTGSSSRSSSDRQHNYRAGGGRPVRVRDRVRIDNTIIEPGGVDRFEFEFGSTHNYRAGGGGPVRVRVRVRIDHTIIEPGGGVDRFEFEFEFGSATKGLITGGGPVRVRVRIDPQQQQREPTATTTTTTAIATTHNTEEEQEPTKLATKQSTC